MIPLYPPSRGQPGFHPTKKWRSLAHLLTPSGSRRGSFDISCDIEPRRRRPSAPAVLHDLKKDLKRRLPAYIRRYHSSSALLQSSVEEEDEEVEQALISEGNSATIGAVPEPSRRNRRPSLSQLFFPPSKSAQNRAAAEQTKPGGARFKCRKVKAAREFGVASVDEGGLPKPQTGQGNRITHLFKSKAKETIYTSRGFWTPNQSTEPNAEASAESLSVAFPESAASSKVAAKSSIGAFAKHTNTRKKYSLGGGGAAASLKSTSEQYGLLFSSAGPTTVSQSHLSVCRNPSASSVSTAGYVRLYGNEPWDCSTNSSNNIDISAVYLPKQAESINSVFRASSEGPVQTPKEEESNQDNLSLSVVQPEGQQHEGIQRKQGVFQQPSSNRNRGFFAKLLDDKYHKRFKLLPELSATENNSSKESALNKSIASSCVPSVKEDIARVVIVEARVQDSDPDFDHSIYYAPVSTTAASEVVIVQANQSNQGSPPLIYKAPSKPASLSSSPKLSYQSPPKGHLRFPLQSSSPLSFEYPSAISPKDSLQLEPQESDLVCSPPAEHATVIALQNRSPSESKTSAVSAKYSSAKSCGCANFLLSDQRRARRKSSDSFSNYKPALPGSGSSSSVKVVSTRTKVRLLSEGRPSSSPPSPKFSTRSKSAAPKKRQAAAEDEEDTQLYVRRHTIPDMTVATYGMVGVICGGDDLQHRYRGRIEKVKFGVPIAEAFSHDIPATLLVLLLKINKEGPLKKDIWRAPGNQAQVRKLSHIMQHGRLVNISNISVYTAASVIKKFLAKLPGGIFGPENEQALFTIAQQQDLDQQRMIFCRVVCSLSVPSQHLLVLLFGTFRIISDSADTFATRMTPDAVGISVAPSLFHTCMTDGQRAKLEDVMRFKMASQVIARIIEGFGYTNLFPRECYEFYARITGRTLKVDEHWHFTFQYPSNAFSPSKSRRALPRRKSSTLSTVSSMLNSLQAACAVAPTLDPMPGGKSLQDMSQISRKPSYGINPYTAYSHMTKPMRSSVFATSGNVARNRAPNRPCNTLPAGLDLKKPITPVQRATSLKATPSQAQGHTLGRSGVRDVTNQQRSQRNSTSNLLHGNKWAENTPKSSVHSSKLHYEDSNLKRGLSRSEVMPKAELTSKVGVKPLGLNAAANSARIEPGNKREEPSTEFAVIEESPKAQATSFRLADSSAQENMKIGHSRYRNHSTNLIYSSRFPSASIPPKEPPVSPPPPLPEAEKTRNLGVSRKSISQNVVGSHKMSWQRTQIGSASTSSSELYRKYPPGDENREEPVEMNPKPEDATDKMQREFGRNLNFKRVLSREEISPNVAPNISTTFSSNMYSKSTKIDTTGDAPAATFWKSSAISGSSTLERHQKSYAAPKPPPHQSEECPKGDSLHYPSLSLQRRINAYCKAANISRPIAPEHMRPLSLASKSSTNDQHSQSDGGSAKF
ncbi:rhoGAP domain-containing protein [Ditylenchus destructor]|nr:rhoGAP domain-containing protein [Ditylenchus destructor]